jgi:hypothetical protein
MSFLAIPLSLFRSIDDSDYPLGSGMYVDVAEPPPSVYDLAGVGLGPESDQGGA